MKTRIMEAIRQGAADPFVAALYHGGGKGGGSSVAAAEAQSAASKEIANQQNFANRPTITTPWGQQTWGTQAGVDPATGQPVTQWSTDISLSPEQQAALDAQMRIQSGKSQAAETLLGQATGAFQTPFDWESLTKVGSVEDAQRGAFEKMSAMLQPGRAQEQQAQRTRLANLGLSENDEAAMRAQQGLAGRFASQDQQLLAQALGEGRSTVELQQRQRAQQIAEEAQRRGMPLNELNALLTGQQVGMPGMPSVPTAAAGQAPDYMAANAQKQAGGTDWGAIAGTAAMGAMMMM